MVYRAYDGGALPQLRVLSAPSNNVLYWDAQTQSLVQQLLPQVAYGPAQGLPLRTLPVTYTSWSRWQRLEPHTTLADPRYELGRDRLISALMRQRHHRTRIEHSPFLATGKIDPRLHPKTQLFVLREGGEARAYTRTVLRKQQVVQQKVGGQEVAVFYDADSDIAMAYRAEADGQELAFRAAADGLFIDARTGSRWDVLGRALSGPLAGQALQPVPFSFDKAFWFAWQLYHPDTALQAEPKELQAQSAHAAPAAPRADERRGCPSR